jgi:hypothetical protein
MPERAPQKTEIARPPSGDTWGNQSVASGVTALDVKLKWRPAEDELAAFIR